jgi:exodeoxyribonuclease VII small subunit
VSERRDDGERRDYDAMTFEELVAVLEALCARIAEGQVGIEEAAELFEEAGRVHALAAERLERVRERIARLDADT